MFKNQRDMKDDYKTDTHSKEENGRDPKKVNHLTIKQMIRWRTLQKLLKEKQLQFIQNKPDLVY